MKRVALCDKVLIDRKKPAKEATPMSNSIHYFEENGIPNLKKITDELFEDPTKIAEFNYGVEGVFLNAASKYIGDVLTEIDKAFRRSEKRLMEWYIVRTDTGTKTTHIGDTTYEKTLFKNKKTGERVYLVDVYLGFEPHDRLTEDALTEMLKEAVQTSYRKGGESASLFSDISKEAVKDHLHILEFPTEKENRKPGRKRKVDTLFIEADEDHIHLQFKFRKGDMRAKKLKKEMGSAIVKLVYVHEGVERVAPKSKRHRIRNPHYFSGIYEGEQNKVLWDDVYEYIRNNYDIDSIKKIYLISDGGGWIKAGARRPHGVERVLDEFHLRKYVLKMTRHVDGIDKDGHPAMDAIIDTIKRDTKEDFLSFVDMLMMYAGENTSIQKRVTEGAEYILNNWTAAKLRLAQRDRVCGSSTEGHVSHVLSSRMSTLPLGWSKLGADKMAHLRAFYWNHGNMLDLVRYQKTIKDMPMAAGAERDPISAAQMIASEHLDVPDWGRYYESMQVTLGASIRKSLSIVLNKHL